MFFAKFAPLFIALHSVLFGETDYSMNSRCNTCNSQWEQ